MISVIRLLMYVFWIFPLKRKVFFSSFEGQFIACNPKYIYLELKKRHGNSVQYVWEHNNGKRVGYKTVKHNSLQYIFHIMTSKIIVTNTGISAVFPLRKKQLCINTWHGAGAYKKVGKDIDQKTNGVSEKRMRLSNANTTYFISGCEKFTIAMSNAIGLAKEKFLRTGLPRNDYLVNGNGFDVERIKERIGISNNKKIVLYAPTFRGITGGAKNFNCCLDFVQLIDALKQRFGGDWVFAYRCHYHMKSFFMNHPNAVDLSEYEDMQELLAVTDVLISDYSSAIWDYSFTSKPTFLFCYDLDDYKTERNFYVPIEQWGFSIAKNNEQLQNNITDFSYDDYAINIAKHHNELGSYEKGMATNYVCDILENVLNK